MSFQVGCGGLTLVDFLELAQNNIPEEFVFISKTFLFLIRLGGELESIALLCGLAQIGNQAFDSLITGRQLNLKAFDIFLKRFHLGRHFQHGFLAVGFGSSGKNFFCLAEFVREDFVLGFNFGQLIELGFLFGELGFQGGLIDLEFFFHLRHLLAQALDLGVIFLDAFCASDSLVAFSC